MRLLILLPAILIPAWASSSLAFHMMCPECKLNIQGDNIQPWHTPFLILNQSVVPCLVLTIASSPAYQFLRRQGRWSGIPISLRIFPQFVVIHAVKGFGIVNKAEIDVFLDLSCFFYDPVDVGNLISGSFVFSKSSLYIWKFSVHILLKRSLKDFTLPCWHVKWVQLFCTLNILWCCLSLGFIQKHVQIRIVRSCFSLRFILNPCRQNAVCGPNTGSHSSLKIQFYLNIAVIMQLCVYT